MMKRYNLLFIASLFLTFLPVVVLAQPYVPLEPLPFFTSANPSFPQYLQAAFRLAVLAGAALAVLMLTLGGVQYMTSDVLGQKEQGRSRIKNALLGFLLLLAIVTILETVNPNLLKFTLITQMVGRVPSSPATTTEDPRAIENPAIVNPDTGGVLDAQLYVIYETATGNRIGVRMDATGCQRLVNNATAKGARVISGTCGQSGTAR